MERKHEPVYKYSYKVKDQPLVSLSVCNVGYQKCEPLYQWGPGVRDHYLIHYIIGGKGYYESKGTSYALEKGDVFFIYPNMEITYYADQEDPWEYAWVGFLGSDIAAVIRNTDFNKKNLVLNKSFIGSEIKEQLIDIYESRGSGFENAVDMTGKLYVLFATFMKYATHNNPEDNQLTYVEKGIAYIANHYSYPITIEDMADYVGVSRSYLFRSFREHLQCSPKEYLSGYRMKQACRLLQESQLSVTAIAKSVGYEDNLYFSKAFKKIVGCVPSQYEVHIGRKD